MTTDDGFFFVRPADRRAQRYMRAQWPSIKSLSFAAECAQWWPPTWKIARLWNTIGAQPNGDNMSFTSLKTVRAALEMVATRLGNDRAQAILSDFSAGSVNTLGLKSYTPVLLRAELALAQDESKLPKSPSEPSLNWAKPIATREGIEAEYLGLNGSGNYRDYPRIALVNGCRDTYTETGKIYAHNPERDRRDLINVHTSEAPGPQLESGTGRAIDWNKPLEIRAGCKSRWLKAKLVQQEPTGHALVGPADFLISSGSFFVRMVDSNGFSTNTVFDGPLVRNTPPATLDSYFPVMMRSNGRLARLAGYSSHEVAEATGKKAESRLYGRFIGVKKLTISEDDFR